VNVLIIPEDQSLDQYIVKPVVEAMFRDAAIPARVDVLPEPRLRGCTEALNPGVIAGIVADNPMADLFLLIVDRDCNREGNDEKAAARQQEHEGKLIACVAIQEVEVWMLALHAEQLDAKRFTEVRAHCDPKELWADPLLDKLGRDGPGQGRKRAMRAIVGNWRSLSGRCPELATLQAAVIAFRAAQA
jgi:hypothetical protein